MELENFKKTEVGLIPNDWQVASIGEICDIKVGRDLNEDRYSQITDHNFKYPVFSNTVSDYGLYGYYNFPEYDGEAVTVVGRGVGLGCAFPRTGGFGAIGRLLVLFPNKTIKNNFLSSYINNRIIIFNESGGIPQLTGISFSKYKVPVPPKKEQEAIANALSDADAYIKSLEKLTAKKRLIKKGVMQELLSPKENWKETTLVELCDNKKEFFDDGDWIEAEHITDSGIRLIQTGNIGVGAFLDRSDRKYIYESSFHSLKCKPLQEGDLLVCRLADPEGRACILPKLDEDKVITSVDVTICRPLANKANRQFLVQLFSTDAWLTAIAERSGGTTHKRIARGSLGKLEFKIPALDEQKSTAAIFADIDTDILAIENRLQKARLVKQGMMQELLTGRIRLA